jgi:hypothetical protein
MSSMGIAKSAEPEVKPAEKKPFSQTGLGSVPEVGWDILRFFNVGFDEAGRGSTTEQLKDIEHWTYKDDEIDIKRDELLTEKQQSQERKEAINSTLYDTVLY